MSPDLFVALILTGGFLVTIVGVVVGLVLTGRAKFTGAAGMVNLLRQRVPELGALPEDQQIRLVKRSLIMPSLLAFLALFSFMLGAVFFPPLLNFINSSGRSAGFVGVVLLVLIVVPFRWLQARIVRRGIKQRGA